MTKKIALISLMAALYVALVVLFSAISYGPIQFRIAEILKPIVIFEPIFTISFVIGLVIANLFSPYVGFFELLLMPLINLIALPLMYYIGKKFKIIAIIIGAIIVSFGVSIVLHFALNLPIISTIFFIFISEFISFLIGLPLMRRIYLLVKKYL